MAVSCFAAAAARCTQLYTKTLKKNPNPIGLRIWGSGADRVQSSGIRVEAGVWGTDVSALSKTKQGVRFGIESSGGFRVCARESEGLSERV